MSLENETIEANQLTDTVTSLSSAVGAAELNPASKGT